MSSFARSNRSKKQPREKGYPVSAPPPPFHSHVYCFPQEKRGKNKKDFVLFMLILASQSPSRARLLTQLGIPFQAVPSLIDETPLPKEKPLDYIKRISQEKAYSVASSHPERFILAADTIVALGTRILMKAKDEEEARAQLALISGRRHRSCTALCLVLPNGQCRARIAITHVAFKALDAQEIDLYIASNQWRNVAVYQSEGRAAQFIRFMRGQPSTLMGLPLFDTYQMLRPYGLVPPIHG